MKTLKPALIKFKGYIVNGLIFPKHIQKINDNDIPKGYVSNGKQQFEDGTLRITLIPESFRQGKVECTCKSCGRTHDTKKSWVSSHKCHICSKKELELMEINAKEEAARDGSAKNFYYHLHKFIFNKGFNSRLIKAVEIFENAFDLKKIKVDNNELRMFRGVKYEIACRIGVVFKD